MTVFVVSAPSVTGNTTLNRRLIAEFPEVEMCISHTTRSARPNEVNGRDYHFVDKENFESMVAEGRFIEWAEVHGNFYGTSKCELDRLVGQGKKPILEIDVQGWEQAEHKIPDATSIFILPPSFKSLWERLEGRGSDSLKTRWTRLQNAYDEISKAHLYNNFIINEDIDQAYSELKKVVIDGSKSHRHIENGKDLCKKLNDEFKNADWIKSLRSDLK